MVVKFLLCVHEEEPQSYLGKKTATECYIIIYGVVSTASINQECSAKETSGW